jgi:hypothetical protein
MINTGKHSRNKHYANVYTVGKHVWPHFILTYIVFIKELTLIIKYQILHRYMEIEMGGWTDGLSVGYMNRWVDG